MSPYKIEALSNNLTLPDWDIFWGLPEIKKGIKK